MCNELGSGPINLLPSPRELFAQVETEKPIIIAVSGGSDSVALLHLASSWAKTVNADIKVVTVDHGLRPEAAAEAAFVAGISETLNLQHFTLAWDGVKPATGISEAARDARYMLIAEFAHDIGADTILTGHTMDDQAETVWMRNSRLGESQKGRGLSGMGRSMTPSPGLRVLRPLLDVSRQQLRNFLADIGQTWIEDPTNFDQSYERVRARYALSESEIGIPAISRFAELCGRLRRLDCESVCEFLQSTMVINNGPVYELEHEELFELPPGAAVLAIRVLVAIAGGREHFISDEFACLILDMETGSRKTAGYCVVEKRGKQLLVYRENRNLPFVQIEPGDRKMWDGRLLVENNSRFNVVCRAIESNDVAELEKRGLSLSDIKPKAVVYSMPLISDGVRDPVVPFSDKPGLASGIVWHMQVPAIELFCSDHDQPLLELVEHVRGKLEPVRS